MRAPGSSAKASSGSWTSCTMALPARGAPLWSSDVAARRCHMVHGDWECDLLSIPSLGHLLRRYHPTMCPSLKGLQLYQ